MSKPGGIYRYVSALTRRFVLLFLVLLLLGSVVMGAALSFRLQSGTVGSGGGEMSGGVYSAVTTAGQPVSGGVMAGGSYRVASGLWTAPPGDVGRSLYLPLVTK